MNNLLPPFKSFTADYEPSNKSTVKWDPKLTTSASMPKLPHALNVEKNRPKRRAVLDATLGSRSAPILPRPAPNDRPCNLILDKPSEISAKERLVLFWRYFIFI